MTFWNGNFCPVFDPHRRGSLWTFAWQKKSFSGLFKVLWELFGDEKSIDLSLKIPSFNLFSAWKFDNWHPESHKLLKFLLSERVKLTIIKVKTRFMNFFKIGWGWFVNCFRKSKAHFCVYFLLERYKKKWGPQDDPLLLGLAVIL